MSADTISEHAVVWLRPEYEGRADELVTFAEGANEVGVSRAAVSNWANRHADFPETVLLTGSPRKRTKYVVRQELIDFARIQRNKRTGPRGGHRPHRPRVQVTAEKVKHYEGVLRKLALREERQAQALERTRAATRAAEKKLAQARGRLAAEVAAAPKRRTATADRT